MIFCDYTAEFFTLIYTAMAISVAVVGQLER